MEDTSAAGRRLTTTTHAIMWVARCKQQAKLHRLTEKTALLPSRVSPRPGLASQIHEIVTSSKLNLMLLFVPTSFLTYYAGLPSTWTFVFSCLSLCPLAGLLGDLTEDLALRYNDTIGALLNASFGNATELIVSIFALQAEMYDVVKNSLVGSVLGNMMLVLGTAFLAAGLRPNTVHEATTFNSQACHVYCSLLLLATMGMIIPTVMFMQMPGDKQYELRTSREISVLMASGYVLYVIFQLFTHKKMFEEPAADEAGAQYDVAAEPSYTAGFAMTCLLLCTLLISFESEFVVGTLEPAAISWGLSNKFISIILLPIVGNAAEHSTAVTTAFKGKADIALGVAVGSSIQISLFVVPALVLISWAMGRSLDLNFEFFILALMVVSVVITKTIVSIGSFNWLSGAMLLLAYGMIAIALFNSHGEVQQVVVQGQ